MIALSPNGRILSLVFGKLKDFILPRDFNKKNNKIGNNKVSRITIITFDLTNGSEK